MNDKQKNALKGAALAVLVAGGTGIVRLADGAKRLLGRVSEVVAVNVSDIRAVMEAMDEEGDGENPPVKNTKQK